MPPRFRSNQKISCHCALVLCERTCRINELRGQEPPKKVTRDLPGAGIVSVFSVLSTGALAERLLITTSHRGTLQGSPSAFSSSLQVTCGGMCRSSSPPLGCYPEDLLVLVSHEYPPSETPHPHPPSAVPLKWTTPRQNRSNREGTRPLSLSHAQETTPVASGPHWPSGVPVARQPSSGVPGLQQTDSC